MGLDRFYTLNSPLWRAVPAKWVVEPTDQSVYVGTHVAINCLADGQPKPTIRWKQAIGMLNFRHDYFPENFFNSKIFIIFLNK